jgi:hypothetical protein
MSERYTIQGGLEHHLYDRFGDNAKYALPLLILLIGLVVLWAQHFNATHQAARPFDLGIYTVKTASGQNNGNSGNSNKNTRSAGNPLLSPANSSVSPAGSTSSTGFGSYDLQGTPASTSPTATGGMGGGSLGSSSGTGTTSGSGGSNISATLQTPSISVGSTTIGGTTTTIDPGVPKLQ